MAGQIPAIAQTETRSGAPLSLPAVKPAMDCAALAAIDISKAVGAPTHITAASVIENGKPAPYCKVLGYVEPAIKFEVRLPTTSWTQRLVQTGCGGLCGSLNVRVGNDEGCTIAQNGELALTSTDMGHEGDNDGIFGARDYQLRIDFAYRGVHLTTVAAKALIASYYGQQPKYSYFMGCSDGGREALMEAQRYPQDFNGITAGSPAMNFVTQNTFYHGWNARMNTGPDGKAVITAERLPILHKAVVEQCDAADGLKDGLISDPLSCHPDVKKIQCKAGEDTANCLTAAEVHTAEEIYRGAHDAQGGKLVISGPLPGSELAWAGVYVPQPGSSRLFSTQIALGTLQNLAYDPNPAVGYQLANLKFDRATFDATTKLHTLYDSTDPDLSPYTAVGGKLILWHGLADQHISPVNTIAYYTAMQKVMGAKAVDSFARLYLVPGEYHCGGGEGPNTFDLLTPIMAWAEQGIAPNALMAAHSPERPHPAGGQDGPPAPRAANAGPPPPPPPPLPPLPVDRTRPIYPYPYTAKYTGTGSIDDAANFVQGPARPAPAERLQWFGSGFYSAHYETWCAATGTSFSCKDARSAATTGAE